MPLAPSSTFGQVTVASTAGGTLLSAAKGKKRVTFINHGTTPVFIGKSGVTTSTGILLAGVVGQSLTLQATEALYGITASGTQAVGVCTEAS